MNIVEDAFDRLCKLDTTEIIDTEELFDEIWRRRIELYDPRKLSYANRFFDSFYDFINEVHHGKEYSQREDIMNTSYWEFIKMYHPRWQVTPLGNREVREMLLKIRDGIGLYYSIKKDGMRDPLGAIVDNGKRFIYRGCRRLVVAKVLNYKTIRIKNAIINNNTNS